MKTLPPPLFNFSTCFKWDAAPPPSQDHDTGDCGPVIEPADVHDRSERHWLLDHFVGRDVLISQLRLSHPEQAPPWNVIRMPGLDSALEGQIDVLGYRNARQPTTQSQDLNVTIQLFGVFIKLWCKVLKSEIAQMRKEMGW